MSSGYRDGDLAFPAEGPGLAANTGSDDSNSGHGESSTSIGSDILQSFPYLRNSFGQGQQAETVAFTSPQQQQASLISYKGPYAENLMQIQGGSSSGSTQLSPAMVTQPHVIQGRLPAFNTIRAFQSSQDLPFSTQPSLIPALQSLVGSQSMQNSAVSYTKVESLPSANFAQQSLGILGTPFTVIDAGGDMYIDTNRIEIGKAKQSETFASSGPKVQVEMINPVTSSFTSSAMETSSSKLSNDAKASFDSLLEVYQTVASQTQSSSMPIKFVQTGEIRELGETVVDAQDGVKYAADQPIDTSVMLDDNDENKANIHKASKPRKKGHAVKFFLKGCLRRKAQKHPKEVLSEMVDSEEMFIDNVIFNFPSKGMTSSNTRDESSSAAEESFVQPARYTEPSLADIRAGALSTREGSADQVDDANYEDFDKRTDDYDAEESSNLNNLASIEPTGNGDWYGAAMKQYEEIKDDESEEDTGPSIKKGGRSDPENPFALTSPSFSESAAKALMTTTASLTATIVTISIMSIGSREKLIPKIIGSKAAEGGIVSIVNPMDEKETQTPDLNDMETDTGLKIEATPIVTRLKREKKDKEDTNSEIQEVDTEIDRLDINIRIDDDQYVNHGDHKRWQCKICPKSYTTKHNLVAHILDHSGIKPHLCLLCGRYFKQLSHLNTHMLTHDNVKPHKCPVCSKGFTQISHLKRHETVHLESKPYICDVCQRGFAFPSELRQHQEKHVPGKERCNECDQEFATQKELRDHMLLDKHCNNLTCKHCERVFKFPSQLKDHMTSHAGARPFICSECGMDFMKEHHLRAHQFTHTGLRPHTCPHCHRAFNQKANMMRHMLIHNASRAFRCDVCHKTFTQPQTLKAHMVVHADKKPYQCKFCGKQFGRLHNLQGHLHIHTDSKPYVCSICQSAFTLKGNLNRHKKVKHGLNETTENMEEDAVNFLSSLSGRAGDNLADTDPEFDTASSDSRSPKKGRKSVPRKHVSPRKFGNDDSETGKDVDNCSDTEENSNFISYSDEERENEERLKKKGVKSKYFESTNSKKSSRSSPRKRKEASLMVKDDVEETGGIQHDKAEQHPIEDELEEKDENENGIHRSIREKKGQQEPERRSTRKRKRRELSRDEFEYDIDDVEDEMDVDEENTCGTRSRSSVKSAKLDSIIATKFKNV